MGEQQEVDAETVVWSKLWLASESFTPPGDLGDDHGVLEALCGEDLRRAAMTFPADTGRGVDNISPRAFARLSDELLEQLAWLLAWAEQLGRWPTICQFIMIVLLPKPDGGRRPIGLFHSIVRLWGRARSLLARRWEADNDMNCLFGGAGKGAQRAAWQASFRSETAAQNKRAYGQALLDMAKCFEHLRFEMIWEAAKQHGYPLILLRLPLAS